MNRFATCLVAAMAGLGIAFGAMTASHGADLPGVFVEESGVCAEQWVLSKITSRFGHQVRNVPNLPDVGIVDFQRIHENRYLPALGEERPIGRRYCEGTVILSDGHGRNIWYLIEEGQGFASIGDNVEFCVDGFDRWNVYNSGCRILR